MATARRRTPRSQVEVTSVKIAGILLTHDLVCVGSAVQVRLLNLTLPSVLVQPLGLAQPLGFFDVILDLLLCLIFME